MCLGRGADDDAVVLAHQVPRRARTQLGRTSGAPCRWLRSASLPATPRPQHTTGPRSGPGSAGRPTAWRPRSAQAGGGLLLDCRVGAAIPCRWRLRPKVKGTKQYSKSATRSSPDHVAEHSVSVEGYEIDRHEVSAGDFSRCIDASVCHAAADCIAGEEASPTLPTSCATRSAALRYCEWVGGELPDGELWEVAGRGGGTGPYPWGDAEPTCELATFNDDVLGPGCGEGGPRPVGSTPAGANSWGIEDMAGNRSEWVKDTTVMSGENFEITRGGSFASQPDSLRLSFRTYLSMGNGDSSGAHTTFRCIYRR
jgi:hypothetical protein